MENVRTQLCLRGIAADWSAVSCRQHLTRRLASTCFSHAIADAPLSGRTNTSKGKRLKTKPFIKLLLVHAHSVRFKALILKYRHQNI